uniref:ADP-ribosylation factor-like protein 11 n=1 Tax=Lepeophtheirus salmonis TaxID=72036 RepID=A0A0K2T764_LEPSM
MDEQIHNHSSGGHTQHQTYWNINNYSIQQNVCYCRVHSALPYSQSSTLAPQFIRQYRTIEPNYSNRGIVPETGILSTPPSRRHKSNNSTGGSSNNTSFSSSSSSSGNSSMLLNTSNNSCKSSASKSSGHRHRSKFRKDHHHHYHNHPHHQYPTSPQIYKSAPSSPVNNRHDSYLLNNNNIDGSKKKPTSPEPSRRAYLTLDKLERGNLLSEKPSAASTPLISGCCGGVMKDLHSSCPAKKKSSEKSSLHKRRSGSYSALDSVSTDSSDGIDGSIPAQPSGSSSAGNCVKNIVSWMSKVGKGTSALLDSLPSAFKGEDHHVVMVGLDSAGKTTVLYRLKFDQYINTVPTIGFNCEKIRGTLGDSRGLVFLVWDVGGQEKIRPLWRPYTRATDGIIFVVDSTDTGDRLDEAKMELHRIMKTQDNVGVPLLVIANKQDLPTSKSAPELERILELSKIGNSSLWYLEPCCAVTGEGLDIAIEKLHELIVKRRKIQKRIRNKTR